jgi:hypothetical protein
MKKHVKKCKDFRQISNDVLSTMIMPQVRYDNLNKYLHKIMKTFVNLYKPEKEYYSDNVMDLVTRMNTKTHRMIIVNNDKELIEQECDKWDHIIYGKKRIKSIVSIGTISHNYYEYRYKKNNKLYYRHIRIGDNIFHGFIHKYTEIVMEGKILTFLFWDIAMVEKRMNHLSNILNGIKSQ